jgi:hypothetical protein
MQSRTTELIRTELSHVRAQIQELLLRTERISCLVETQHSESLAVREENHVLRMIPDHSGDGVARQERTGQSHDDVA